MRIIFIGDIFGKIGRRAVAQIVPKWKKQYAPDFILGNNENLAHGVGITARTIQEMLDAGLDGLTGGNHTFRGEGMELLQNPKLPILRPANYPPGLPGRGDMVLVDKNTGNFRLLVVNLIGRVFFRESFDDPFRKIDEILSQYKGEELSGIFVDFHTEASSEQNVMGHYADGRVSAVVGTHTHIGTVDARLLPKGTAFVTDVGGVIAVESILGENIENITRSTLLQRPFVHEPVETGLCTIGAVLVDIDEKTKKANSIIRIDEKITIN